MFNSVETARLVFAICRPTSPLVPITVYSRPMALVLLIYKKNFGYQCNKQSNVPPANKEVGPRSQTDGWDDPIFKGVQSIPYFITSAQCCFKPAKYNQYF